MPTAPDQSDLLAGACELVGRFNYHFGHLEEKLNAAIAKLFKLDDASASILTANIDFVRKVYIVRSAVIAQNASPKEKWLTKEIHAAFSAVLDVNNDRQIVAHASFEPNGNDEVVFKRIVARKKLVPNQIVWTKEKFEQRFDQMRRLDRELEKILRHIQPYVPKLDFSDPRNSMYLGFF
jgi:hypothetical protein